MNWSASLFSSINNRGGWYTSLWYTTLWYTPRWHASRRFSTTAFLAFICAILLGLAVPSPGLSDQHDDFEFFEQRIRPILVEHCYECHNSTQQAEADLALDFRDGLRQGGSGGELLDFEFPNRSRLLKLMRHEVEGLEMPQGRPKLPQQVLVDFEHWIRSGGPDPRIEPPTAEQLSEQIAWPEVLRRRLEWWCYQPIRSPAVPAAPQAIHPIDSFVYQQMRMVELSPTARAMPQVLVRRLYLTLIGLPPTADEARYWVGRLQDENPQVRRAQYEALVDHLLASPHFGERWARHWMDWIRYAESHGSEGDPAIVNAFHYRDYLIRALNQDVPYNQLLREHLAGDLLDEPRIDHDLDLIESKIATAHWRMVFHGFAPTDALDEQVRFTDDQLNVFSKAFLGLTVSCARCHDHKFDAIGQDDYYALYGILNSNRAGRHEINYQPQREKILKQLQQIKHDLRRSLSVDWKKQLDMLADRWASLLAPSALSQETPLGQFLNEVYSRSQTDQSVSEFWQQTTNEWKASAAAEHPSIEDWFGNRSGLNLRQAAGQFAVATNGPNALAGIYPSGWYSHTLSAQLPARLTSVDIEVTADAKFWLQVVGDGQASVRYVVRDYPRDGTVYPLVRLHGGQWKWQPFDVSYWAGDTLHLELSHAQDSPLLVADVDRSWFGLRRAMLLPQGSPPPSFFDDAVAALLAVEHDQSPQDWDAVTKAFQIAISEAVHAFGDETLNDSQSGLLAWAVAQGLLANKLDGLPESRQWIESYRALEKQIEPSIRVPGLVEATVRDQALFVRGDHRLPAETVPRRFLAFLDSTPYPTDTSGRLQLAEDLLRPDNPLTRRVIVNRLWHHLFGQGIVATPDNFGRLGSTPTHPELLDWLADRFSSTHDWSLKRAIREIVLSETWQQAATRSATATRVDPENKYLSHFRFRRLEAEAVRDSLLQVAGSLDTSLYGPSLSEPGHSRRAIYSSVKRNSLNPFLRTFDFPEPSTAVGSRDATHVPAQSLTLLNDPLVQRAAADLAGRILADSNLTDIESQLTHLVWQCYQRPPRTDEVETLRGYLTQSQESKQRAADAIATLRRQQAELQSQVEHLLTPVREQIAGRRELPDSRGIATVSPIALWDFQSGIEDQIGNAHARVDGDVTFDKGAAIFNGQGYLLTAPLKATVTEKTLEAWVRVSDLNQRGGGVLSLQSLDGNVFDAIVFGERDPGQWMAGSEGFNRTQGFGGSLEVIAATEVVHIAIAYDGDGRVRAYRNGQPYGTSYQTSRPIRYEGGRSVVTIGLRHLPATGNRFFSGQVHQARVYDQALSDQQVMASFQNGPRWITQRELLAGLNGAEVEQWTALQSLLAKVEQELATLQRDVPEGSDVTQWELAGWAELIQAVFLTQEFITLQ